MLTHPKSFVKNFFQVFSNFIEAFRFACCSLSNFAMLAHPSSFVKNFFQILSNFFWIRYSFASLASDLRILAHSCHFVKYYFYIFFFLFLVISIFSPKPFVPLLLVLQPSAQHPPVARHRSQIADPQTAQRCQVEHQ